MKVIYTDSRGHINEDMKPLIEGNPYIVIDIRDFSGRIGYKILGHEYNDQGDSIYYDQIHFTPCSDHDETQTEVYKNLQTQTV